MSDCSYEELRSRISGLCNLAGMNLDVLIKTPKSKEYLLKLTPMKYLFQGIQLFAQIIYLRNELFCQ